MDLDKADPKGLVRESYRIDGITLAECRSVFLDWALSLPAGQSPGPALTVLMQTYGAKAPGHPMTQVLHEGAAPAAPPARRGGHAGRVG